MINLVECKTLSDSITYLQGGDYRKKLDEKNLPPVMIEETQKLLESDRLLRGRAVELIEHAQDSLRDFYGEDGDIMIPFSGGRDSTALAMLSMLIHPDRNVRLVTVVTGFANHLDHPREQAEVIKDMVGEYSRFNPDRDHYYLDLSDVYKSFLVNKAEDDFLALGFPPFCSSCKILMEHGLAEAARALNTPNIAMGYNRFQADQMWPEQHPAQIAMMKQEMKMKHPGLNFGNPLYDVVALPFDSTLILAYTGLALKDHKREMPCGAAGTNPREIEVSTLEQFVVRKNGEVPHLLIGVTTEESVIIRRNGETSLTPIKLSTHVPSRPDTDHWNAVQEIRRDPRFCARAYNNRR